VLDRRCFSHEDRNAGDYNLSAFALSAKVFSSTMRINSSKYFLASRSELFYLQDAVTWQLVKLRPVEAQCFGVLTHGALRRFIKSLGIVSRNINLNSHLGPGVCGEKI